MIKQFFAILLSIFILAGPSCRKTSPQSHSVLRFNMAEGLETLDPAFARNLNIIWAVHGIYNTLVNVDSSLQTRPSLAYRWEMSGDDRVYTFHLRRDVFFQDNPVFPSGRGRKMVASDVVYSFKRIMDPATSSSGAWIFDGKVDPVTGFIALDDSTFRLTLFKPFHPILGILSMPYCSVVPHEVVEKYGKDFRSHPCGTGPFMFKSWDEGQDLILLKNPHYFEKDSLGHPLPYLDALKISFVDSKATEFLMFLQGQLDFMKDLDESYKDEVLTKGGNLKKEFQEKIRLVKFPYLNTEYLGFVMDTSLNLVKASPVRVKAIRLAINYGFDREKMVTFLRNRIGLPANAGIVPDGLPAFDSNIVKGYRYDPMKAQQLLVSAGFPGGIGLPPITLYSTDQFSDFANFVASQLQDIGIRVRVEIMQIGTLRDMAAKSELPFFRAQWIADYPDAESFLAMFYGPNPAPPNYTRFKNQEFDSLYEKALVEPRDSERYGLYHRMEQIVIAESPVVPLYYDQVVLFLHPNVKGLEDNPMGMIDLTRTRLQTK